MLRTATLIVVLSITAMAAPAWAEFCMLTQNGLHLGQGQPAYKEAKRDGFKTIFKDYDVVNLQEVMDPAEPARVAPLGFTATVSQAKGHSSYREYYALLTRDAAVRVLDSADYPDHAEDFARPPFGVAVEDKHKARYWLVDIHAVFGRHGLNPRRLEVAAITQVTKFYRARTLPDGSTVGRVVVAGDWNLPATDVAFAALAEGSPGIQAAPNVKSSLNSKGEFASPYDHFVWNRDQLAVHFADDPRDTGGLVLDEYRNTLSDHAGIAGYVQADPAKSRPDALQCPPSRLALGG